jgi:transposase InsO family protein
MGWRVESMESKKKQFILLWETRRFTKVELCRDFGISRPTGDALIKRYLTEGWDALDERSRDPRRHPNQTSATIEDAIIGLRRKYPNWGARKVRTLLLREHEESEVPSATTVNNILRKHGLTAPRRKARRRIENQFPIFDPEEPNEVWSADFKGKFQLLSGVYCHPLTIADSRSRYLFIITALDRPTMENCIPLFEKAFRENGLPLQIHTDNGAPFGNALALRRMTRLSVWFMELGITPVYSDPGHPEQNGRHERMHRELKAASTRPPGKSFRSQQKMFDRFREEYNQVRPHEALGMQTPAAVHQPSPREFPGTIRSWDYDKTKVVRYVTHNGAIRWGHSDFIMVSTALAGKYIGLEELADGIWGVYYRHVHLGTLNVRTKHVYELNEFRV